MSKDPSSSDISLQYISDALAAGNIEISDVEVAVSLPTFRRPEHLLKTLSSVAAQNTGRNYICIVMENDPDGGEGAKVAEAFFRKSSLRGIVINAHRRGNCSAYNAGWHTALETFPNLRWVMVIDDDEVATPDWIEKMTAAAEDFGVDMVGGPQKPVFEGNADQKWSRHPVFQPAYQHSGKVDIIYSTGNVLIAMY